MLKLLRTLYIILKLVRLEIITLLRTAMNAALVSQNVTQKNANVKRPVFYATQNATMTIILKINNILFFNLLIIINIKHLIIHTTYDNFFF